MPDEWWNVTPPSVYLVPFGAPSGTYEQEVALHFNPPRSAEAEAKVWELEVVAVSRASGRGRRDRPRPRVEITPYEQLESELRPEIVTGRRRGEFALMVRNRANAPIDTMVTAVDSANALEFVFAKQRFVADPGRRDGTTFTAKAKKNHWIGRTMDRRFEISAHGVAGDAASTRPITGTFRQKPWFPYWVPIVVPAIIAAAVLIWTLIPHKTTVPNLHGMTADAANIALRKANLKPPTQVTQVPSKTVAYLHVVRQNPSYHDRACQARQLQAEQGQDGRVRHLLAGRAAGAEPRRRDPGPGAEGPAKPEARAGKTEDRSRQREDEGRHDHLAEPAGEDAGRRGIDDHGRRRSRERPADGAERRRQGDQARRRR